MGLFESKNQNTKAPQMDFSAELAQQIVKEFPHLSAEEQSSLVNARLKRLRSVRPQLIKMDLGKDSSKKTKDTLFE